MRFATIKYTCYNTPMYIEVFKKWTDYIYVKIKIVNATSSSFLYTESVLYLQFENKSHGSF